MEQLKDLYDRVMYFVDNDDFDIDEHFTLFGSGQINEIHEKSEKANGYYKFLYKFCELTKPKQIVELGAASGISTVMMAVGSPESKIISVDCDPHAWEWMNRDYSNVMKIRGDDLNLRIYPKNVDLSKTDFWFFDSLHTKKQLESEIKLYKQFFKPGAVIAFDDIHINPGMNEVWKSINYPKLDVTERMHHTGWGLAIIK